MNNDLPKFSWKARFQSFVYAWEGIIRFFRTEHNARIHLFITAMVIICSMLFKITRMEWVAVSFSIAFVWVTEMINTAIEKCMDFITLERLPQIKNIKDLAAGAVLVATITAVTIGLIIFIPRILH